MYSRWSAQKNRPLPLYVLNCCALSVNWDGETAAECIVRVNYNQFISKSLNLGQEKKWPTLSSGFPPTTQGAKYSPHESFHVLLICSVLSVPWAPWFWQFDQHACVLAVLFKGVAHSSNIPTASSDGNGKHVGPNDGVESWDYRLRVRGMKTVVGEQSLATSSVSFGLGCCVDCGLERNRTGIVTDRSICVVTWKRFHCSLCQRRGQAGWFRSPYLRGGPGSGCAVHRLIS